MQCPSMAQRLTAASAARHARAASSCVLPPSEGQPGQWRSFVCHANAGCVLEVTALTSHHGLAQKERGLPPVQCPSVVHRPIPTSAARRARAASSRISHPPERQPAQWRLFACHENAGCALEATARMSHHGLAPKERRLPPVKCHSVACNQSQPARHGACARQAHVFRHLPGNSQRSGACASATQEPAVRWRSQLARRTTALHRGERPSAGAVPFRVA